MLLHLLGTREIENYFSLRVKGSQKDKGLREGPVDPLPSERVEERIHF